MIIIVIWINFRSLRARNSVLTPAPNSRILELLIFNPSKYSNTLGANAHGDNSLFLKNSITKGDEISLLAAIFSFSKHRGSSFIPICPQLCYRIGLFKTGLCFIRIQNINGILQISKSERRGKILRYIFW